MPAPGENRSTRGVGGNWLKIQALGIFLAALFVYLPVFSGDWIWDDHLEVTENELLTEPAGLVNAWTGEGVTDYLPVKVTVQRLFLNAVGMSPVAWHVLNFGLHLLNAFLVWRLLSVLGLRQAWLGGLLFGIHPVLVMSVAWISEFKNTLSLALLLPAMLAYLRFVDTGKIAVYCVSLGFFVLAVLSKGAVVMFPVVILLYLWWKKGRVPLRDIVYTVPVFLISLTAGLITIHFQHTRAIDLAMLPSVGLGSRFAIAGLAVSFYFFKGLAPVGLLPTYPRWPLDSLAGMAFLAWGGILAILAIAWMKRAGWGRAVLLGGGFFLINLLPVLGFVPMSFWQFSWVSDHFVYLPVIGPLGLLVAGVDRLWEKAAQHRRLLAIVGGAVLCGLLLTSRSYAGIFVDEISLWSYTLRNNPAAWQAHLRLGKIMIDRGENEAALLHNAEAVRLQPNLAVAHNNYAVILGITGDDRNALLHWQEAMRLAPRDLYYPNTLGEFLLKRGRYQEGASLYAQMVKLVPGDAGYQARYGEALLQLGEVDAAIERLQTALSLDSGSERANRLLAAARAKKTGADPALPKTE